MSNLSSKVDEQTAQDARILASIGYQDVGCLPETIFPR